MRLVNSKYNLIIEMQENKSDILVIENPNIMSDIVGNLHMQCEGNEGDFVLSEKDKMLKIDKHMSIVVDPFSLDFNDRKIINKLYFNLKDASNDYFIEKEELNTQAVSLIDKIVSGVGYNNITFRLGLEWESLFKIYDIKLEQSCDSLLEKICEYVKILSGLCSIDILCLVNIMGFLSETEFMQMQEMAFYNKVQLFLVETKERPCFTNQNIYVIDKDQCLIVHD